MGDDFAQIVMRVRNSGVEDGRLRAQLADCLSPQITLSVSLIRRSLRHSGRRVGDDRGALYNKVLDAWEQFVVRLATWENAGADIDWPGSDEPLVLLGWHFPESPGAMSLALEREIILLISDIPPWLEPLRDAGLTINVRKRTAADLLVKALEEGRHVGAMLDHTHPRTSTVRSRLLGHDVLVPSGLLAAAARMRRQIHFCAPREGRLAFIDRTSAYDRKPKDLAQWFNDRLDAEVRARPDRWLMWLSLLNRTPEGR
jgi:hypothetical protein